jgi:UDP-N-acetyl-D-mannosaminuronate dehydrogenase
MKVGVIGLGYVGLPLAVAFAEAGHDVVGLDSDPRVVDRIRNGASAVEDVPAERLTAAGDRLRSTTDHDELVACDALAMLCDRMGIDVWEVVDAAGTKPFGFMRFEPGPGMGGHCLPVDPFYLAFKAREHDFYTEFIELAGKINQNQPLFCVRKIERTLNEVAKPVKGSRILLLGVAYNAGVADLRESPALKVVRLLRDLGAEVFYHDPPRPGAPRAGNVLGRPRR